jgi:cytochrome c biogenesis protein CcdA
MINARLLFRRTNMPWRRITKNILKSGALIGGAVVSIGALTATAPVFAAPVIVSAAAAAILEANIPDRPTIVSSELKAMADRIVVELSAIRSILWVGLTSIVVLSGIQIVAVMLDQIIGREWGYFVIGAGIALYVIGEDAAVERAERYWSWFAEEAKRQKNI